MDLFFSAETIADVLSVSKRNVISWVNNGKLVPELNPDKYQKPYTRKQLEVFHEFNQMFNSTWDEQISIKPIRDYSLIELFAGGGGLALGLEKAGFKSLMLNELEKAPCDTLKTNRPHWNVIHEDICNIDFTKFKDNVDLLTGGFPCQPFSYAGKKLGLYDIRGTLVFQMLRAIQEIRPKVFLIENVKGLESDNGGKTLLIIIEFIKELGYSIIEKHVYKTMMYKVPQKRERFILIGVRNELADKAKFERPSYFKKIVTVRDALKKGILYDSNVPDSPGQKYPVRKEEIMSCVPEGGYWRDLPLELQMEYMKGSFYLGGGKTGMARRLSWDKPSLTLTCAPAQKQTERCHPSENRPLTTREYARIQTFPDDWIFKGTMTQIYKQIGNAVPVNFAIAIGKSIVKLLNDLEKR
ncbi:MAG: DNA (cytosine-5-)-methyltransferase [Neisseriaceae bacterium]|nr:MAG: DNA (cytosine-5-)-methyltransferase [Neisseriaceae bacterium]